MSAPRRSHEPHRSAGHLVALLLAGASARRGHHCWPGRRTDDGPGRAAGPARVPRDGQRAPCGRPPGRREHPAHHLPRPRPRLPHGLPLAHPGRRRPERDRPRDSSRNWASSAPRSSSPPAVSTAASSSSPAPSTSAFRRAPAETLRIWDRNAVVSDIVRVIRTFRPDVIVTRFSPQGGGHGHHTASAILAVEAFKLAGDPKAFPEQIGELAAWQPKRILQNGGGWPRRPRRRRRRRSRLGARRDRRQRPGHRRAARGDRRAEPVDAQEPGLRQLRRGRRRRRRRLAHGARSRSWPASRRRMTSSTASTRPGPACPAEPRSRSWPTRRSRSSI